MVLKFFQKLGRALVLPIACLPVGSLLTGIGYWIDPTGWGANNLLAAVLIASGNAIISNLGILFAIGIAIGMADDNDATAGLAGLVSWLVTTNLLKPATVAMVKGIDVKDVPVAFTKVETVFLGIIVGLLASWCCNKFRKTKLPDALGFFSGKRSVAIVAAVLSIVVAIIMFFIWPPVYDALVAFGKSIVSLGAVGAGLYVFFNRLLIVTGLHNALNAVFWFDVAGINDIGNFWSGKGTLGVTGMYMTGFFPIMMFGLPGAALAMYHTAKDSKKKAVFGLLFAGALSAFLTGVTEPLEFAFMFLAPGLYFIHAVLSGVSAAICTLLPVRAGFNFSAGFIDWFLSFKAPMAQNPLYLLPIGLIFFVIYYVVFRFAITKFNLKTPGREDDEEVEVVEKVADGDFAELAKAYLKAVGGKENIVSIDNCVTRLRLVLKDTDIPKDSTLKALGAKGVIRLGKGNLQIVVGTNVQFVADAFRIEASK